jgi:hypothetical protein
VTTAPSYFKGKLSQLPLFVLVLVAVSSCDNMLLSDQTIAPSYCKGKLSELPLFVLVLGAVSSCDNMLVSDQSTSTPELPPRDNYYKKYQKIQGNHLIYCTD